MKNSEIKPPWVKIERSGDTYFKMQDFERLVNSIFVSLRNLLANLLILNIFKYRKVTSASPSHLEAHAGFFFRLSMKDCL